MHEMPVATMMVPVMMCDMIITVFHKAKTMDFI